MFGGKSFLLIKPSLPHACPNERDYGVVKEKRVAIPSVLGA